MITRHEEIVLFDSKSKSIQLELEKNKYIVSVGINEISFDNYIYNITDELIIYFKSNMKGIQTIVGNITIPKGYYEVDEINKLIQFQLPLIVKNIQIYFDKKSYKFIFINQSKNIIVELNKIAYSYFNLNTEIIDINNTIISADIIDVNKVNLIFIKMKNIVRGMNYNKDIQNGKIICCIPIKSKFSCKEIVSFNNVSFFDVIDKNNTNIELCITNEKDEEINIKNVFIKLIIKINK